MKSGGVRVSSGAPRATAPARTTRAEALEKGRVVLAPSPTASLDASLILASLLGLRRETVVAFPDEAVGADVLVRYDEALVRRAAGRPVAYLTGKKEFYGRDFVVNEAVLVPRPDTELLVELALDLGDEIASSGHRRILVHECCVGSGAVALSVAAERPAWLVSGSDLSPSALEVAIGNASRVLPGERPGGPVRLFLADLFENRDSSGGLGDERRLDLILANPPYVESALARELSAAWGEPLLALDGGVDGLDLVRRLVPTAAAMLDRGGALLVEADGSQAAVLRSLFRIAGLVDVRSEKDLAGVQRVTVGVRP